MVKLAFAPRRPSGIYSITCANGHRYVGSACDLQKRWNHHRHVLRHGRHGSSYLQRAWDKYGEGAFVFEVLEEWDPEFLVSQEQWWINALRPEYNMLPTAGSSLGHKPSLETRAKRSATLMGHPVSAESRSLMSEAKIGKKQSPEHVAKRVESRRGYRCSDETKAKKSASAKLVWAKRRAK